MTFKLTKVLNFQDIDRNFFQKSIELNYPIFMNYQYVN